jgi:C_GCAxxG_C_C family probable redox protein
MMKMKMPVEKVKARALELLHSGNHCGPSILRAMWEAYGWKDEDLLWAATVMRGGMGGQQRGTCGAVAAAGVCLGLRHRWPLDDKDAAEKAREAAAAEAKELADEFIKKFGAMSCLDLVGMEITGPESLERAKKAGVLDRCNDYIRFVIDKLYELEEKRK